MEVHEFLCNKSCAIKFDFTIFLHKPKVTLGVKNTYISFYSVKINMTNEISNLFTLLNKNKILLLSYLKIATKYNYGCRLIKISQVPSPLRLNIHYF